MGLVALAMSNTVPGRSRRTAGARLRHWLLVGLGTVLVVLGAVSLFAKAGGGLYWVTAGIVLATTGGVANAWVLLVEILR